MSTIKRTFRDLAQYPSAILGLVIILILISVAVYALVSIPYREAVRLWRGGEDVWGVYPRLAAPEWTNWFRSTKLPSTIIINSEDDDRVERVEEPRAAGGKEVRLTYTFNYNADLFPSDLIVQIRSNYQERQPHVEMTWETPDGREIRIGEVSARRIETYRMTQDSRLLRRLRNVPVQEGLFSHPDNPGVPLKGEYKFHLSALLFEDDSDTEARFVVYGQVYGPAGTDHRRRDLTVALLWGTPIALAFGLLAALGTTITTMLIAAVGVWFSGIVDELIQRITEVSLILPVLPILIMVGTFYSKSIGTMLGVVIILSIFGAGIKTYRAIFLQVRESPYIEAARAYGAGSWRIIISYLVPRIIPLLVPQLVVLVPSFVFLEATLAVLGLGDPIMPTWGKIIDDAFQNGALHNRQYYWVLQPAVLLMMTGLGFSMVGFALDRIFNPRLRGL
jgi:peptide/nickel transport system permease protein